MQRFGTRCPRICKPSNWNRIQAKIKGIQSTFADLFSDTNDDDATKTLIIPIVEAVHFFVLVVEFNFACHELFLRFEFYDSLRRSSRGGPGVIQGTPAFLIAREVRDFFFNFVLHGKNKLNHITLPSDDNLIRFDIMGFHQCPGQYNDIDCGLFCIAVVIHLLDFKPVTEETFNFNHCILLRSKLAAHFNRKNDDVNEQTSQVVQDCFPHLKGTGILSSYGVEVVATVPIASKPSFEDTKNDDEVILLSREDIEIIELEQCIIPQGISPNGDQWNQTFDLSSFDVSKLEIFNRNGTLVYSKKNYTNEWHGQTNQGDQLPVGTYFYTMEYQDGKRKSAWVYINE